MARHEQDREDLLAEATALVERASFKLAGAALRAAEGPDEREVVAGFRRDGGLSLFCGAARVYQFTSTGELRRAFANDEMLKAQAGRLVAMRRHRTAGAVELVSRELDADASRRFIAELRADLDRLRDALAHGAYQLVGSVPVDADVVARLREWLARFAGEIAIAAAPGAR